MGLGAWDLEFHVVGTGLATTRIAWKCLGCKVVGYRRCLHFLLYLNFVFNLIPSGSVTSALGFLAGAVRAGIKSKDELDLALLCSEVPCIAAGIFSTNQIKSAPVILSQRHIVKRRVQAIVVNSGCANACTGRQGLIDAMEMANLAAIKLGVSSKDVLVASTGVIGLPLPMDKIKDGLSRIKPTKR